MNGTALYYGKLPDPKARKNVRHVIRDLVSDQKVFDGFRDYMFNGGVCGHKMMDLSDALNVVIAADEAGAKRLGAFKLNKKQLGDAFKAVLRERCELNKYWKIVGPRFAQPLASDAGAAPDSE